MPTSKLFARDLTASEAEMERFVPTCVYSFASG
jgi:hypothetical protein